MLVEMTSHEERLALIEGNKNSNYKIVECSRCCDLMDIAKDMAIGICWKCFSAKATWPSVANESRPVSKPKEEQKPEYFCKMCGAKMRRYLGGYYKCPDEVMERGLHAPRPKKIL